MNSITIPFLPVFWESHTRQTTSWFRTSRRVGIVPIRPGDVPIRPGDVPIRPGDVLVAQNV